MSLPDFRNKTKSASLGRSRAPPNNPGRLMEGFRVDNRVERSDQTSHTEQHEPISERTDSGRGLNMPGMHSNHPTIIQSSNKTPSNPNPRKPQAGDHKHKGCDGYNGQNSRIEAKMSFSLLHGLKSILQLEVRADLRPQMAIKLEIRSHAADTPLKPTIGCGNGNSGQHPEGPATV